MLPNTTFTVSWISLAFFEILAATGSLAGAMNTSNEMFVGLSDRSISSANLVKDAQSRSLVSEGNISVPGTQPTPLSSDPTCHRYLQFTLASDIQFSVCHHLGKFEVGLDLQSSRFGYKLYFLVCGVQ